MICSAAPYTGNEPRISAIGAFCDDQLLWPLIERMARKGFRVWHDAEIRKVLIDYSRHDQAMTGTSAAHLIYLTEEASENHIFRERFTRTVDSGKPFIVILNGDEAALSLGMRLQLKKAAAVISRQGRTPDNLLEELLKAEALKPCLGAPNESVVLQDYSKGVEEKPREHPAERPIPPTERTIAEFGRSARAEREPEEDQKQLDPPALMKEKRQPEEDQKHMDPPASKTEKPQQEEEKPAPEDDPPLSGEVSRPVAESELDKTVKNYTKPEPVPEYCLEDDLDKTLSPYKAVQLPVIASMTSGERFFGLNGETTVGKYRNMQSTTADVVFHDSCVLFSRKHMQVICVDGLCVLVCRHPNGMVVNGTAELQDGEKTQCKGLTVIQIPSNMTLAQYPDRQIEPALLVVAPYEKAEELIKAEGVAFLQSKETGEIRGFCGSFKLGRSNPWESGAVSRKSMNISRDHADIELENGEYILADHASNGTVVDGRMINNERATLKDGSLITIEGNASVSTADVQFVFRCAFFERSRA